MIEDSALSWPERRQGDGWREASMMIGSFRLEYEYEVEYKYDFSNPEVPPELILRVQNFKIGNTTATKR